jgi:hypothetical protein
VREFGGRCAIRDVGIDVDLWRRQPRPHRLRVFESTPVPVPSSHHHTPHDRVCTSADTTATTGCVDARCRSAREKGHATRSTMGVDERLTRTCLFAIALSGHGCDIRPQPHTNSGLHCHSSTPFTASHRGRFQRTQRIAAHSPGPSVQSTISNRNSRRTRRTTIEPKQPISDVYSLILADRSVVTADPAGRDRWTRRTRTRV